jgi:uncharacterized damage-inducible protein DinB
LGDAELKLDRQAFFSSILGTLNHILVGDRVWLSRFEGQPITDYQLNDILYDNFADLRAARQMEDKHIRAFIDNMPEGFAEGKMTWTNNSGVTRTEAHSLLLAHLFNHQTHHRGQVTTMLSQAGGKTPVLDLPWVLGDQ